MPVGYTVRAVNALPRPDESRVSEEHQFIKFIEVNHPGDDEQSAFRYHRISFIDTNPKTDFEDQTRRHLPVTDERLVLVTSTVKKSADTEFDLT